MQSSTPGHIPPDPDDDSLPQGNKRRRISEHTTESSGPSRANALGRDMLIPDGPKQRGSSREMSPPEGAASVKYTRTGRVSKATKGQRVHHCDECGKTYTRAEHLRRHQQNHKPGAFPCDIPGCGRSFYREDLLTRHKARHDDPNDSLSQPASPASQDSIAVPPLPGQTNSHQSISNNTSIGENESTTVQPSSSRTSRQYTTTTRTKDRYLNLHELQFPIAAQGSWPNLALGGLQQWNPTHWEASPPHSPTGYESPSHYDVYTSAGLPYFPPQAESSRNSSDTSHFGSYPPPHTSRSPVSAGSSTVNISQWSRKLHDMNHQHMSSSYSSEGSLLNNTSLYTNPMAGQHFLHGNSSAGVWTPEDRDFMEQDELMMDINSSRKSSLDLTFDDTALSNEEKYLRAYWAWVHPFYPVVHQPSFDIHNTSPLLKAAMLALGAQAMDEAVDKKKARLLHERSMKVLQKRTLNEWHSFRLCDMQAVVLVEVYAIYKSRRPPLQFSKVFEEVYKHLASDPTATDSDLINDPELAAVTSMCGAYLDHLNLEHADGLCKQRLLQVCFVLDIQHATLFDRPTMNCLPVAALELPFPSSQGNWDGQLDDAITDQTPRGKVWQAVEAALPRSCDIFQSLLIMSSICEAKTQGTFPIGNLSDLYSACALSKEMVEQSPRAGLAYYTMRLCTATPLRNLLAVAGESWIMSEKLSTRKEFAEMQRKSRQWAEGIEQGTEASDFFQEHSQGSVLEAVGFARKILEIHWSHPKTRLPFQEWAIYLASVVIWARAYVTASTPERMPRLSVPQPAEPRLSIQELDRTVLGIIATDENVEVNAEQAKNILLWTKAQIERENVPHNCGLTDGALDVLHKLITRGGEEAWFS